jgi:ABC-type Fe3+ transport system permease subunit/DNA-binding beta-propeller fold protein YncE
MNWFLLQNSLLVSIAATMLAAGFGFCAALCCAAVGQRWRKLFLAAAIVALVLPPFLVTNCWIELFGETGTWRRWIPLNIYSLGGTVWILALLNWPITMFFTLAAWRRLESAQMEVDPLLRGTALVRWLLWPMARAGFGQAAALTFLLALNNFAVPAILQVKVFPAEVWVNFNTTFNYRTAVQSSWPLILTPLLIVLWFGRKDILWQWRQQTVDARTFRKQLGKNWLGAATIVSVVVLAFSVALPTWQLAASPKTWREIWPALAAGQSALIHSVALAAVTATVVVLVAALTWRARIGTALWIPLFVPGVLLGIGLIWIFNRPGLAGIYQSAAIVVLAWTIRYAAVGWNSVARGARATDRALTDVARLEGATRWQVFRHVLWPQVFPTTAVAWYVTYLLCLWDVETLVLIVPPGGETLALRVFNLLHYGHNAQVNAICMLLLALAVAPLILHWVIANGRWQMAKCLVVAMTACLLSGCSNDGSSHSKKFPIESRFFSHVEVLGTRGAGLGEFNKPRSVALDRDDNLFVVDMTGRVQKFSSNGVFLFSWQMPQTDKGKPKGMCTDAEGNIIVIEPHYSRVNHFSPDGKLVVQWGNDGTNFGQLAFPRGVAVNSRGEIYVSEYERTERVQRFTARGEKCLGEFGRPGSGAGEFSRAEGIGVDKHDHVFVADSCNHRIQVFSVDGKFLREYGKAGSGVGELSYPYDVRTDSRGFQYVCEFGNSRIQIFDDQNKPVEILGGVGGDPGQFSNPWSIALDSKGNLFVADSQNHRVQKFVRKEALLALSQK